MRGGVRKRYGNWYYYFDVGKIDGKRKKIERKAIGAEDKADAERILRQAIAEYENTGIFFEPSETTLHDYLDFWMNEHVELNLKHNTVENYRGVINNHIKPNLGLKKLRSLTPENCQKFINAKFREGFSRKTMTIFHSVLKNSLDKAVYPYQLIKVNPMHYVKIPKFEDKLTTKKDLKILSRDTIKKIISYLQEDDPFYIPFHIGLNTGMRVSEVCALTWDCVDLENGLIKVEKILINVNKKWEFGSPKTKSSYREIEIGQTLINILKKQRNRQKRNKLKYGEFYTDSDFVCTKENGDLVTTYVCKWNGRKLRDKLSIDFNFHSLRHTHATLLMESGAKPKAIQERLGHSRLSVTTDTYSHLTKKMRKEVVDIFESAMHD
ncbi:site-specific integrase [Gracilibacillus oryzae]|uniref:Site-specific integrase n=1 Tax=Gracilibacillus oryzae TaxID=1672701 RepID=A0A7C8KPY3_9BACI|nr:site-specific integrase [Gracilibacillus oryzae]KAB8126940.1 site-specific integrase [Gracilibacillus oryzae]